MSYSVWLDGNRIGDTDFELRHGPDRHGGVFHPTAAGLAVLPSLTSMAPALLDVGRMCRESGIDTEDPSVDVYGATEEVFQTPEGHRAMAAARHISRLVLHDSSGSLMVWKSILITDMTDFVAAVAAAGGTSFDDPTLTDRIGESPVRYFISATLAQRPPAKTRARRGQPVS